LLLTSRLRLHFLHPGLFFHIPALLFPLLLLGIFIYLQQTLLGIMNGLGKQGILLRNSIVGYVIRILFVIYFVPSYGIAGYIAVWW